MSTIAIASASLTDAAEAAGHPRPDITAHGGVSSRVVAFDGCSLWIAHVQLGVGAALAWNGDHGDEALYVVAGELEADGRRCGPDGVVIVESGVATVVRAITRTTVVHFGSVEREPPSHGPLGPPDDARHGVHVLGGDGIFVYGDPEAGAVFYADSACPTCRLTLHRDYRGPTTVSSHTHSQDELIYLLDGEIQIGPTTVAAGDVVLVPALRRYGFRSSTGFEFLNYRRDASIYVGRPGEEPMLETIEVMRERARGAPDQRGR